MRYSACLALHGRGLGFGSEPQNTDTISNKSMWGSTPGSWARGSAVLQMFTSALLPLWAPTFPLSTSVACSCLWLTSSWPFSFLFSFWAPSTLFLSSQRILVDPLTRLCVLGHGSAYCSCPRSGAHPVSSHVWLPCGLFRWQLWELVCGLGCAQGNSHHAQPKNESMVAPQSCVGAFCKLIFKFN